MPFSPLHGDHYPICLRAVARGRLFTRINAAFLTAMLSVAILQNILADRDPQLAILYVLVMVSMAFLGGGRFSLDARLFSRRQQTTRAVQNEFHPSYDN